MSKQRIRRHSLVAAVFVSIPLLAACGNPPLTYDDPNGPRNGDGLLVDPRTGISLPGQADPGI